MNTPEEGFFQKIFQYREHAIDIGDVGASLGIDRQFLLTHRAVSLQTAMSLADPSGLHSLDLERGFQYLYDSLESYNFHQLVARFTDPGECINHPSQNSARIIFPKGTGCDAAIEIVQESFRLSGIYFQSIKPRFNQQEMSHLQEIVKAYSTDWSTSSLLILGVSAAALILAIWEKINVSSQFRLVSTQIDDHPWKRKLLASGPFLGERTRWTIGPAWTAVRDKLDEVEKREALTALTALDCCEEFSPNKEDRFSSAKMSSEEGYRDGFVLRTIEPGLVEKETGTVLRKARVVNGSASFISVRQLSPENPIQKTASRGGDLQPDFELTEIGMQNALLGLRPESCSQWIEELLSRWPKEDSSVVPFEPEENDSLDENKMKTKDEIHNAQNRIVQKVLTPGLRTSSGIILLKSLVETKPGEEIDF